MLREVRIRNLAIIDDIAIRFDAGLNILSGETGAGKSIVVDALGLALGDRAQSDLIKSGKKEATVQAFFDIDDTLSLPDIGIDTSEGLILRRVLLAGGKSRAFINDMQVTLQTLAEVSSALVDVHGQHEHQSLLTADKQRAMVDYFGRLEDERGLYADELKEAHRLQAEVADLKEKGRERAQRIDMLKYQTEEIRAASLRTGERESLEEERNILANLNRLKELIYTARDLISGSDSSCHDRLVRALMAIRDVHSIDGGVSGVLKNLEAAEALVEDVSFELRAYEDRLDFDSGRLEHVEDRLDLIRRLERKYGEDAGEILAYCSDAEEELDKLLNSDEVLSSLEEELVRRETALMKSAQALTEKRKKTAKKIESLMKGVLKELALEKARFKINVLSNMDETGKLRFAQHGADRIEFLFSANEGEPPRPLAKVVSGGELSRVMLALKSILADADEVPVLIFDEVDAGIGGKTAETVGRKLREVAAKHQLICVTHLPQIARFGEYHLRVEKTSSGGKVSVAVRELSDSERRDEIARMMSGTVTETSRKHAEELLERVK